MNIRIIFLAGMVCGMSACGISSPNKGELGFSQSRRVVIVGENVQPEIALYYKRKFDCQTWFTPFNQLPL